MDPDKIAERTQKYDSIVNTLANLKYDSDVSQRLQNATTTYLARTLDDITSETPDFTSMPDSKKMQEEYEKHINRLNGFISVQGGNKDQQYGLAHVRVALDTATFPDAKEFKDAVVGTYESKIGELSVLATSDFLSASFSRAEEELRTRSVYGIIDRNSGKILLDRSDEYKQRVYKECIAILTAFTENIDYVEKHRKKEGAVVAEYRGRAERRYVLLTGAFFDACWTHLSLPQEVQDKQAYTAAADSLTRFYGNLKFAEEHSDKKEAVVAVVAEHRGRADKEVKRVTDTFLDTMHAPAHQTLEALRILANKRDAIFLQNGAASFFKEFAEKYDSAYQADNAYRDALKDVRSALDSLAQGHSLAARRDAARKMKDEIQLLLTGQKSWLNERIDKLLVVDSSSFAERSDTKSDLERRLNTFRDCADYLYTSSCIEAYGFIEKKQENLLKARQRVAADFKLLEEYKKLEHERKEIPEHPTTRAERKALRAWQERARAYAAMTASSENGSAIPQFEIDGVKTPVHTSVRDWCNEAMQKLPGYVAEAPRRSSGLFWGAAALSVAGICYAGAAYGPRLFDLFNSPKPAPAVVTVEPSPDVFPAVSVHLQPPVYDAGFSAVDAATKSAVAAAPASPAEPALTVEKQLPYTPPKRQFAITQTAREAASASATAQRDSRTGNARKTGSKTMAVPAIMPKDDPLNLE